MAPVTGVGWSSGLKVCSAAYWPCGCGHFADLPLLETGGTELLTPESGQEWEAGGETPSLDVQPAVTTWF